MPNLGRVAAVIAGVVSGAWGVAFITALIMAVLTPPQAAIGHATEEETDD